MRTRFNENSAEKFGQTIWFLIRFRFLVIDFSNQIGLSKYVAVVDRVRHERLIPGYKNCSR